MLDLRAIARALEGVVQGDQVLAPGPGHSKRDRSLSVRIDPNAPDGFVVYSHCGDSFQDCRDHVRQRLGMAAWRPGEGSAMRRVNGHAKPRGAGEMRSAGSWVYTTADGTPYLRVERLEDADGRKSYPQFRFENGRWIPGRPKGPKIPYRLPELVKADRDVPVFVTEGEKCADAVAAIGLVATTASEGAGKWSADLNEHFRDRVVAIVPDADEPGRRHALKVAENLHGVARDVRIVDIPGLGDGEDVYDWLGRHHTDGELLELFENAPAWSPPQGVHQDAGGQLRSGAPRQRQAQFATLADVDAKPVDWLWPGRIPRKFVLFTGPPDCGKTLTVIDVVARVTRGMPWPDEGAGNAPFGSVIILTAEDGVADTIRPRADVAGADVNCIHVLKSVTDADGRPSSFTFQDDLAAIAEKVRRAGDVGLIVVDPITAYLGGGRIDTHRTADVRAVLSPLKDFSEDTGVAVIGLTHPPKAVTRAMNAATGSQAFVAAARAAWLFTRESTDGKETGRTLMTPIKNNLTRRQTGLAFTIVERMTGLITAPAIVWDATPIEISADQALAAATGEVSGDGGGRAVAEAMQFLEDELKTSGAERVEASVIEAQARKAGIAPRTLKRAKKQLGIVSHRDGFGPGGRFYLRWPDEPAHRGPTDP